MEYLGSATHSFPRATAAFSCTEVLVASPPACFNKVITTLEFSKDVAAPGTTRHWPRQKAAFPTMISFSESKSFNSTLNPVNKSDFLYRKHRLVRIALIFSVAFTWTTREQALFHGVYFSRFFFFPRKLWRAREFLSKVQAPVLLHLPIQFSHKIQPTLYSPFVKCSPETEHATFVAC